MNELEIMFGSFMILDILYLKRIGWCLLLGTQLLNYNSNIFDSDYLQLLFWIL